MIIRPKNLLLIMVCCWLTAAVTHADTFQVKQLAYGPDEDQVLDLYTVVPLPDEPMSTVVLAHGGLWQSGDRRNLEILCKNIIFQSNGAVACASIDYRLSFDLGGVCGETGKDTYTDQAHDLALAYSMLQKDAELHRLDPRRMHVGGHSAGAHLAHILNLRWSEFVPPCDRPDGCPVAVSAIGLEGIYDIPAWDDYEAFRWQSNFRCATRRAFGASGPSPPACMDTVLGERCWDAGSPIYLAENAEDLGIQPAGDALLIHSPGDDWADIDGSRDFGDALETAFPDIDVVTDTGGICAVGQHELLLGETSLADCVIHFVFEKELPPAPLRLLNPGLNDAWVSPDAPFQGFLFTVFPETGFFFLSWFTFDSVSPMGDDTAVLGAFDQRWITGGGFYSGNSVTINVELTSGGIFNAPIPLSTQQPGYGTITIVFVSCNEALLTYDFPSLGLSGQMTLTRALPENVALCQALDTP